MRNQEVDRQLRALHATRPPTDGTHRRRLREELLADHRRRYPQRKGWTIMSHRIWFRPALIGAALLTVGIVACSTPTEYDVEMGQQVNIGFADPAKSADLEFLLQEVVTYVESLDGVEGISVSANEEAEGLETGHLMIWGQDLDAGDLLADLVARFPDLAEAHVTITPLEGTAEGSLAEAFGHAVFNIEVDGETAEEIRLEILRQLAAQGYDGEAHVEVVDEDGMRTINIDLEDVQGQEDQAEGGMVIELKQE